MSSSSSTFTTLCRSGTILMSSHPPERAVASMVSARASSVGAPRRAKRRSRRSAIFMLRVPSSTLSSRLANSRLSQTFTALRLRTPSCPMRTPFRVVAVGAERRGAGGADPLVAALVPLLLLLEPLLERLHQFVPAAQRLDLRPSPRP